MNWHIPKNKIDGIELLLSLIAFAMPLYTKILAPLLILTCMILLYDMFTQKGWQDIINFKKLFLTLLPFSIYNCIGLLTSDFLPAAWFDVQVKLVLFLLPILFFSPSLDKIELSKILRAFVLGGILSFLISILLAVYHFSQDGDIQHFTYTGFALFHPTYISIYICFSLAIVLFKRDSFTRKYFYGVLILLLIYIVLLNSKAGILSAFFIILLYILWQLKYGVHKKQSLLHAGVALLCLLFLFFNFRNMNNRMQNALDVTLHHNADSLHNESTNDRLLVWQDALELSKKNLLLGVGNGDVKEALIETYNKNGHTAIAEKKLNAHNQYLQSLLSGGFVLLILLLLPLILSSFLYWKHLHPIPLFFILILSFNMLFESLLEVQAGTIFIGFFLALFWRKYLIYSE